MVGEGGRIVSITTLVDRVFNHRTIDTGGWQIRMMEGIPHVRGPSCWDIAMRA